MGHQIEARDEGIFFTDGAWLVVNWCERFAPNLKPANMSDREWFDRTFGSTQILASAAKIANDRVPDQFTEAKKAGFLEGNYRHEIGEEAFRQCRDFLRYAAENSLDISGSY